MAQVPLNSSLKTFLAKNLYDSLTSIENSVGLYISKTETALGGIAEASVSTAEDSATKGSKFYEYGTRRQILTTKMLTDRRISMMTRRYDWTYGQIYRAYDNTADLRNATAAAPFYVYTDEGHVYVCLNNGGGLPSIDKPKGTGVNPLYFRNGYIWKFLYKVPTDLLDFVDSDWIPIRELPIYENKPYAYSDEKQLQYEVQYEAVAGKVDSISVKDQGGRFENTVYASENRYVKSSSLGSTKLDPNASGVDDAYNDYSIRILSGQGAGQIRKIVGYNGSTRVATLSTEWSVVPNDTSHYEIIPTLTISGDGTGAEIYAKMTPYYQKTIESVVIVNNGSNYSYGTVSAEPEIEQPPEFVVAVSPIGGLGSDPLFDLKVERVSIIAKIEGREEKKAIIGNDYQRYGLWFTPKIGAGHKNEGKVANTDAIYRLTLDLQAPPGTTFSSNWIQQGDYIWSDKTYSSGKVSGFGTAFASYSPTRAKVTIDSATNKFKKDENIYVFRPNPSGSTFAFQNKSAIIANSLYDDVTRISYEETFRCTHKLNVTRADGSSFNMGTPYVDIPYDTKVTGASGSIGYVADFIPLGGPNGELYLTKVFKSDSADAAIGFTGGETLGVKVGVSTLELNTTSVSGPELNLFSGRIIYIQSIDPVFRNSEQLDLFKINIDF